MFALFTSSLSWAQQSFQPSVRISGGLAETIERSDFQISTDGQRVVYLASQAIDQNLVNELYSVAISGGAASRLSANLTIPRSVEVFNSVARSVSPFQISPDSQRVVYVADQNTNGVF